MNSKPGPITGSWLLTPKVHADSRGQFVESFQKGVFAEQTGLQSILSKTMKWFLIRVLFGAYIYKTTRMDKLNSFEWY